LEKPAITAQDLFRRIARELEEGMVCQHNGIVGLTRIGNDHRHARALDSDKGELAAIRQYRGVGRRRTITVERGRVVLSHGLFSVFRYSVNGHFS
jgi:hypothetical protein